MAWLDHQELKIIQGVNAAPGDNNTVENPLQILNLLDVNAGISLKINGWSPNIPGLESSGIWADSPLSTGRRPLVMQEGNVTETMNLQITSSSPLAATKTLAALNTMAVNARAFWTDNAQYDPIYLKWWAKCGKGPQYALIYNMEMKYEYLESETPAIDVTLTIEREPYWRWIAPGGSPMQWYYEWFNQPYNNTKAGIFGNTYLSGGTLQLKSEFSSSTLTSLSTDNCLIIPGASIPGDAPALMALSVSATTLRPNVIIGKKTAKITAKSAAGATIAQNGIFNAADGTLGTDATRANDTGAVKAPGAANAQRVEISFATATNALRWRVLSITDGSLNSANRFIGRWNIFLRCRQSAGSVGDITMYLRVGSGGGVLDDTDGTKLNVVYPPVTTGTTGNSTDWGLVFMGTVNIPLQNTKAWVNDGSDFATSSVGLAARSNDSFDIGLFALRSSGTAVLYLCDLIMIPIDEGSLQLVRQDSAGGFSSGLIYDETGYESHGSPDIVALNGATTAGAGGGLAQMTGTGIQLTPNVENRLYVINFGSTNTTRTTDTAGVTVNIIPRSRGIRDRANING